MKRSITAAAIAFGALAIAGSAQAEDCKACEIYPKINNVQVASHTRVQSNVHVNVEKVAGNATVSGTAVGNNLSYKVNGIVGPINNYQSFAGVVESNVDVNMNTVGGRLRVDNTAVSNNANLEFCCTAEVNNTQIAKNDPTANTNVTLNSVAGNAAISTTAVANNLSITGQAQLINNTQILRRAPVIANTTVNIANNVGGHLNVTGTAVGNNISVKPKT